MSTTDHQEFGAEGKRGSGVWGEGAWRDILPKVCHFLPPRDRFVLQKVSCLFQATSERSRLAVGVELCVLPSKAGELRKIEMCGTLLDLTTSAGVRSLRVPQLPIYFIGPTCCWATKSEEVRCHLKKEIEYCKERLAQLSLPNLTAVSLTVGPLVEAVLPFLQRHPTISTVELVARSTRCKRHQESEDHMEQIHKICSALAEARVKKLTVDVFGGSWAQFSAEFEQSNLFESVEELSLVGPDYLDPRIPGRLLPRVCSRLTTLHLDMGRIYSEADMVLSLLLRDAPGLCRLSLSSFFPESTEEDQKVASRLRQFALESLHVELKLPIVGSNGDVRASILDNLTFGVQSSTLANSLRELTVNVRFLGGALDMGVFRTDAFLRFPRLHSLPLRMESPDAESICPVWHFTQYKAYDVFKELNRRLRVLEIPAIPHDFSIKKPGRDFLEGFDRRVSAFLRDAASAERGKLERKFVIIFPAALVKLPWWSSVTAVEYVKTQDEGWVRNTDGSRNERLSEAC